MLFLVSQACNDILPILRLLRKGVIPLIQIVIIAALVILLIIDFGKAVMAGKEDEIKSAQKMAIKRIIYAVVVFLVPFIVNVGLGLLANTTGNTDTTNANTEKTNALQCWNAAK